MLQNLVPLIGALGVLIGAIAPAVTRWDRLGRLRRMNKAVNDTPEGKGHDALVEARDAFAIRMSVGQLWMKPALLSMVRNFAVALGLVVSAGVLVEVALKASWAPAWLGEVLHGEVDGTSRLTGFVCYLIAAGIQGWISAGRRGWVDRQVRERLGVPTATGFWSRLFQ